MEQETKKHISYKEYQNKVTKNPNENMVIFVSAFFILLLLFLGVAKQISPDIDVTIGDNSEVTSETSGIEKAIDERLKLLQMEDNGAATTNEEETLASDTEEKAVVEENTKEEVKKTEQPKETVKLPDNEASPAPAETAAPAPKPVQAAKVVVGYYSTKEQADVAKGIIAESGLNITPFVRNIGGAYTIQVGSYSTRDKAQNVTNELLRHNYPARIIME